MPVEPDILLSVGLVAVYLVDSMHFLSIGEAVVTTRGGRPFGLSFGLPFELGGRRVYVPNPLTPFRPDFRVEWNIAGTAGRAPAEVSEAFTRYLAAVRWLRPLMAACALLIALVAPMALALGNQLVFIGATALCLLLSLAACIIVIVRRADLDLTVGQVASLVFVALICLPCSPNLVRAAMKRRRWRLNAQHLPQLGFAVERVPAVRGQVREALLAARRLVEEDGQERKVIDEQLRALEGTPP